jgi:cell division protein FtsI/penicillin-binding protein 2
VNHPPTRRQALATLLAIAAPKSTAASLDSLMDGASGCALLLDIPNRRVLAAHRPDLAAEEWNPPGSAIKPLVLSALLSAAKLVPGDAFPCPGRLTLAGHPFPCSHPRILTPMRVRTALAYSCNCFVAHFAERFAAGELATRLEPAGSVQQASPGVQTQLQALGERHILVTAEGLAMAYRTLAITAPAAIREGLEDAVDYGTAQRARVDAMTVAGKTGSVRTPEGKSVAWFAGFAPSRDPRVVVTVMLQGRSGGSDAAPVASRILTAWRAGRL